jgi:hypothetical protein
MSCRFDYLPRDRQFVRADGKRLLPLAQLSPLISLEAGNLRGGFSAALADERDLPLRVLSMLERLRGWDFIQMPIPLASAPEWAAGAHSVGLLPLIRRTGRHFYGLMNFQGWDAMLAGSSRNFRKNVARLERVLAGEAATVRYFRRDSLPEGLEMLRACSRASWKAAEDRDVPVRISMTDAQASFLKEVDRLRGHEVIISAMSVGGNIAGAQSWVRTGDLLTAGLTFQDPRFNAISPGHAQIQSTLRNLEGTGLTTVDFNSTAPWLSGYTNVVVEFATLLAMRKTPWGRALHRFASARHPGVETEEPNPAMSAIEKI